MTALGMRLDRAAARAGSGAAVDQDLPGAAETVAPRAEGETVAADACIAVEAVSDLTALEERVQAWSDLEAHALEPSPNLSSSWLLPALRQFGFPGDMQVAFAWRVAAEQGRQLVGVFTLCRKRLHRGLPVRVARDWTHLYSFSGTPLVHREHACAVIAAFLDHTQEQGLRATVLSRLDADGAFGKVLREAVGQAGGHHTELQRQERAAYFVDGDVDAYLQAHLSRKRRKEFKRLRARLEESANVCVDEFGHGDSLDHWLDQFHALETAGWKGRNGTAIGCRDDWRGFFAEALRRNADEGRVLFWRIVCEGRPAAMLFAIVRDGRAWLCKIAYDEELARFSPGALIIFDIMRTFAARDDIDVVDSCAQPDHPMIEHIWRDRLAIQDVMVAPRRTPRRLFELLAAHERMGRAARAAVKGIYLKLKLSLAGGKP